MPNQNPDLLDPFDADQEHDPFDVMAAEQRRAAQMATEGLDGDNQAAARAISLEKMTGVPASVISLNQDHFEAQHKAAIVRGILHNNQYLADYANSHSMNATVSKNDWHALDKASDAIQAFGEFPLVQIFANQLKAQLKGFKEGFGKEPIGSWADAPWSEAQKRFQAENPNIWNFIKSQAYETSDVLELANRGFAGAIGAVHGATKEALLQTGMDDQKAEYYARQIFGVVESELARAGSEMPMGLGRTPAEIKAAQTAEAARAAQKDTAAQAAQAQAIDQAARTAKPFIENGQLPPYGADPIINKILEFGAKHDMSALDKVIDAVHKTETREVPEAWASFQDVHEMLNNRVAGIHMDAIERLYPEGKLPEPDDNLLGAIPGIRKKIEDARANGDAGISLPVKDLTKVPKEVFQEVHDDISTWQGGPTLNEVKASEDEGPITYHGTGRVFDQFRDEFQGTGQGSAFGVGHYTAQARGTGESYMQPRESIEGKPVDINDPRHYAAVRLDNTISGKEAERRERAIKELKEDTETYKNLLDPYAEDRQETIIRKAKIARNEEAIRLLERGSEPQLDVEKGQLYRVEHLRDEADYLDYDKPLEQQSPKVRKILEDYKRSPEWREMEKSHSFGRLTWKGRTGEFIYNDITNKLTEALLLDERGQRGDAAASKKLNELGIAGNKFLDQRSRGKVKADFEPELKRLDEEIKRTKTPEGAEAIEREQGIDVVKYTSRLQNERQELLAQQVSAPTERTRNFVTFSGKDLRILGRNDEMAAYDAHRQAAGLVVRPLGGEEFKDIIPYEKGTPQDVTDKSNKVVGKSIVSFKFRDLFDRIDYSQLSPESKLISEFFGKYLRDIIGDIPVHVVDHATMKKARPTMPPAFHRWWTDPFKQEMYFRIDTLDGTFPTWYSQYTILHEGIHGLTSHVIETYPALADRINRVMGEAHEWLKRVDPEARRMHDYAFTNAKEFMAEAISKEHFRNVLRGTPISNTLAKALGISGEKGSMWDAVKRILKEAWQKATGQVPTNSVMDAVLHIGNMIDKAREDFAGRERARRGATEEGVEPIQPTAMGITKKEQQALLERMAKEAEERQAYMSKVIERDERKRQTQEWKENEAKVRETVTRELASRPDFAADRLTQFGELYGTKIRRVRLDEDKLTPEQKAALSPEHYGKNGLDPDQLASKLGLQSGEGLVQQMARIEAERRNEGLTPAAHFNKLVDIETERRMKAQYGFLDDNIHREVKEQVLSPTVMDRLTDEYLRAGQRQLEKDPTAEVRLTKQQVAADAKAYMGKQEVGTINSDKHLAEMGKARREYEKEANLGNKGDGTKMYKALQRQAMQAHYAKEALKYEAERDKADRLLKKVTKRVIEGVPEEWSNWIHTIVNKGGDLVKRTAADLAERIGKFTSPNFFEFARREGDTYPMVFSDKILTDWRKPQESMTLDEWRDWSGAIKTLYEYGRDQNKFELEGKARDRETHRDFLIAQAERERFTKPQPYGKPKSMLREFVGSPLNRLMHMFYWLESIENRLDHFSPYGLWKRSFSYSASRAVNQLTDWQKQYAARLKESSIFDTNLRKSVESVFTHPDTGELIYMDKHRVRKVIQYVGSKTGEDKIIRGYMVPKEYTPEEYAAAKQKLYDWLGRVSDKKDWDFAEHIFGINEWIFGLYEKMVTNLGAVPARRIELNPVTIHGKEYKGGYVKLSYDPDLAQGSKKLLGMVVDPEDAIGNSGFYQASTPRSHEKERSGYAGPLYLKMDRDAAQMLNILRDAAVRPYVVNTMKMYNDQKFRAATKEYLGKAVDEMLVPYVESVAGMGPRMTPKDALLSKILDAFSRNTVARLIGGNVNTIAKHSLSAAANSMFQVGLVPLAREWAGQWNKGDLHPTMSNREFAMDFSQGLQRRKINALETMGGQWAERIGERGRAMGRWREFLAEKGSVVIGQMDLESAIPTWIAAFKQSKIDQIKDTGTWDKGLARDIADRAVRAAHGDTAISSKPEIMRGGAFAKTMTRLYGFFNSNLQKNYEAFARTKVAAREWKEGEKKKAFQDLAIAGKQLVAANVGIALVEEFISPLPHSEDEGWGEWAAKSLFYASSGMIPGVRELVHGWLAGYPTTLGILDAGLKPLTDFYRDAQRGADALDAEHGGKTLKALNSVIGSITGWTNDFIGNVIKYTWDVTHDTKDTPEGPQEHIRDILKGKPRPPEPRKSR